MDEVLVSMRIDRGAVVYRNALPRLLQNGLPEEQVIDLASGTDVAARRRAGTDLSGNARRTFTPRCPRCWR